MFALQEKALSKGWRWALAIVLGAAFSFAAPSIAPAEINRAPYAPYEFLIGTWEVAPEDGPAFQVHRFRWGGGRSYILFSGSTLAGNEEQRQFEGMLMWNGVTRRLDMLLATDLRYGLVQQQGSLSISADGTVVRDSEGIFSEGANRGQEAPAGPEGATAQFRQTYRLLDDGRIATSVMTRVDGSWQSAHPGSDHWVMTKRASAQ